MKTKRRKFLSWMLSFGLTGSLVLLFDQSYRGKLGRGLFKWLRWGKNPRQRDFLEAKNRRERERRNNSLEGITPSTAYLNKNLKAPRIHYSTPKSSFRFPKIPGDVEKYELIDYASFEPAKGPKGRRIALNQSGWELELIASECASSGKLKKSCDVLLCAIRHDIAYVGSHKQKPNVRLYDMLAALSVRNRTSHLNSMIELIEKSSIVKHFRGARGNGRLQNWKNQKSKWRMRWAQTEDSFPIIWKTSVANGISKSEQEKVLPLDLSL